MLHGCSSFFLFIHASFLLQINMVILSVAFAVVIVWIQTPCLRILLVQRTR